MALLVGASAFAADSGAPVVFRVKPSPHMILGQPAIEQPASEEMAEPATEPRPTAPLAKSAPLPLTPRTLNYGSAVAGRGTPAAFQAPTPAPVSRQTPAAAPRMPTPTPASLPPAAVLGGRMVQLGAFRSPAEAEKALGNWRRDVPAVFARVAEPAIVAADLGEKGVFYRVRVPGFADSRRASEFCGEYKGPGRDCYVVP